MIKSDKYKYVFIAIPKTGTKSITKFLEDDYEGKPFDNQHSYVVPEAYKKENYLVFSAVRNPYTRMVSMWYSVAQRNPEKYGLKNFDGLDFDSFVKGITDNITETRDFFYNTQRDFLNDVRVIILFEFLPHSLHSIPFIKSVESFPHRNSTRSVWEDNPLPRRPWREYFTSQKTLNRINSYYEEDFKNLGYRMITKIEDIENYNEHSVLGEL